MILSQEPAFLKAKVEFQEMIEWTKQATFFGVLLHLKETVDGY